MPIRGPVSVPFDNLSARISPGCPEPTRKKPFVEGRRILGDSGRHGAVVAAFARRFDYGQVGGLGKVAAGKLLESVVIFFTQFLSVTIVIECVQYVRATGG
jgi:hypothetical protein